LIASQRLESALPAVLQLAAMNVMISMQSMKIPAILKRTL